MAKVRSFCYPKAPFLSLQGDRSNAIIRHRSNQGTHCLALNHYQVKEPLDSLIEDSGRWKQRHFLPKQYTDSSDTPHSFVTSVSPSEMSLPLRLAMFDMGMMILEDADRTKIDGAGASLFIEFASMFKEFNRTYVWVQDKSLAGAKVNGSYTGMLGLFARNRSDVFLMPLPITAEGSDVIEFGPILGSSPTIFVSILTVPPYDEEVLVQLFRFSADIIITLILALYCFARILSKSEGVVSEVSSKIGSFLKGAWSMIEMMLNQNQVVPASTAGRILVFFTSIGVFFWLQLWQGEMKTELQGYDTSRVAQTFGDVIRLNLTAFMTDTDPAQRLVEHKAKIHPNSEIGRIFKSSYILTAGHMKSSSLQSYQLPTLIPKEEVAKRHVLITNEILYSFIDPMSCAWSKFDFLVGKEKVLEAGQSPWFSQYLSAEYKRILTHKYVKIREAGIFVKTLKDGTEMVPIMMRSKFSQNIRIKCSYRSLEQYLRKLQDDSPFLIYIRMWQMAKVFRLFCFLCLAAAAVLLIEKSGWIESASRKYLTAKNKRKHRKLAPLPHAGGQNRLEPLVRTPSRKKNGAKAEWSPTSEI